MMRFKEFNDPTDQAKDNQIDTQQPQQSQQKVVDYASRQETKNLETLLQQKLPGVRIEAKNAKDTKLVPHIRIWGTSAASLKQAMQKLGAESKPVDSKQQTSSSSFPTYSFSLNDKLYSVVISMKTGVKGRDEGYAGISRKELTPAGLKISGATYGREQLINVAKKAVEERVAPRDSILASALIDLIDSASTGGNTPLTKEQMDHISPILGTISQDFGEILAPLLMMKDEDKAEFPSGANPLVDVKLSNINLSVKALTGSGTSFKSVSNLMDKYESSLTQDTETSEKFNILKKFHPSSGGKNTDKIVAAAAAAGIPEHKKMMEILGTTKLNNFSELSSVLTRTIKDLDYASFLKMFYPAMTAGNWGVPVGLPADGAYYMGIKQKAPKKEKAAGKPSYEANKIKGAANILTYVLGVGLLNYVTRGQDSEKYKQMMTDIVKQADAVLGHLAINPDGTLKVTTKPFSELKFQFQYHAPSHMAGNNLPGFIAIL